MTVRLLETGPVAGPLVILAHGAGAPMDSPFMEAFAQGFADHGLRVVRFEFPYMAARRSDAGRRPPDREAVLLETWREVLATALGGTPARVVIGGKSMGGRIASMLADESDAAGLLCLGYPFHAPGRPGNPRIAHLRSLRTPALIVQGARDPFGKPDEVSGYELASSIRVVWIADGDHDLVPPRTSPRTSAGNWREAIEAAAAFVRTRLDGQA